MSQHDTVIVFTAKSIERMVQEGGTSSWRLDRNHARQCKYVLCTRNANADWVEGSEEHQAAFLVAKVHDVVHAPGARSDDRYLIQFSEFAIVNIPGAWKGDRNPVRYANLREFELDASALEWTEMPESNGNDEDATSNADTVAQPLSLQAAKEGLALTFGVAPSAVEITIRG